MKNKEKQIFDKYGNYDFPTEIKQDGLNTATTQIEEMAIEMSKELCCYYDKKKRKCTNCFSMEEDCDLHCNFGRTLERLSNAGYRKIPEDSVVLSSEEYINDFNSQFNKGYKHGSKETAEKILIKLQPYIGGWVLFKELEKEYGVEIKRVEYE